MQDEMTSQGLKLVRRARRAFEAGCHERDTLPTVANDLTPCQIGRAKVAFRDASRLYGKAAMAFSRVGEFLSAGAAGQLAVRATAEYVSL